MSLEAIKTIQDAEKRAGEEIAYAKAAAEAMISDAEKKAAEKISDAAAQGAAESKALMEETEKRAAENAKEMSQNTENKCAALRAHAAEKMNTAAELIVRRVVKG